MVCLILTLAAGCSTADNLRRSPKLAVSTGKARLAAWRRRAAEYVSCASTTTNQVTDRGQCPAHAATSRQPGLNRRMLCTPARARAASTPAPLARTAPHTCVADMSAACSAAARPRARARPRGSAHMNRSAAARAGRLIEWLATPLDLAAAAPRALVGGLLCAPEQLSKVQATLDQISQVPLHRQPCAILLRPRLA